MTSSNANHVNILVRKDYRPVNVHVIGELLLFVDSHNSYNLPLWQGRSWLYGKWIYNYLCNQCLSPLTLWVRILLRQDVLDTTLYDKACQWLAAGLWFSPGTLVSSTNKSDRHDITEILLKMALNTIIITIMIRTSLVKPTYIICT